MTETNLYASFGQPVKRDDAGDLTAPPTTQKSFIGERYDHETGLIYLNARYLNPKGPASSRLMIEIR